MGASVAPFATIDEAKLFQAQWGGELMSYDDITKASLKCKKKKK